MDREIELLIDRLQLEEHFEGGYYKSSLRSEQMTSNDKGEERNLYSVIYYMLTKDRPLSQNHILKSDEWWFWQGGGVLEMSISKDQDHINSEKILLGKDLENGQNLQGYIKKEHWQQTKLVEGDYAIVSCVVVPGFHIDDFRLGEDI